MTFAQFASILLKRWGLVAICFLCVGMGAFFGSSRIMKPVYQSTALIEVLVQSGGTPLVSDNVQASQQLTQTEAELATTDPVLSAVAAAYPGLSVDDLAKEVTANARDNTQLVEIDVLDASPTRAANLANSIATTLINQQLQITQQKTTPSFMAIVQPARPATSPARPNKLLYIGAGLLIGLLLGIVLAVLCELLDPRIRTKDGLAQLLDWPILTMLRRTRSKEDLVDLIGYNANTEAYGSLQAHIELATLDRPLHTLAITSAMPGEGKSIVAANLAINLAKTGKNVLLVDANLRHPTQHELFGIPAHVKGFSNAIVTFRTPPPLDTSAYQQTRSSKAYTVQSSANGITDGPSLAPFMRVTEIPNLYIMPSGPLPPYPPELLDSKAMQRLLVALSQSGAEVVIFDTPALPGLADAIILATKVDGTLVVVDTTRAKKRHLQQAKAQLDEAGVRVLGCVLNKVRRNHQTPYKKYRNDKRKPGHQQKQKGDLIDIPSMLPITSMLSRETKTLSQPGLPNNREQQATNKAAVSASPESILNGNDQTVKYSTTRETGE